RTEGLCGPPMPSGANGAVAAYPADPLAPTDKRDLRQQTCAVKGLQGAVDPAVGTFGPVVGWPVGGVFVDECDPLVEQVDYGLIVRSAGEGCCGSEASCF